MLLCCRCFGVAAFVIVIVASAVAKWLFGILKVWVVGCDRACDDAADGVTAILVALFSRW